MLTNYFDRRVRRNARFTLEITIEYISTIILLHQISYYIFSRAALLQMASALRKQGELGDAHDYCSVRT